MLYESNITAPYILLLAVLHSACIILPLKRSKKQNPNNSLLHFVQSAFHSANEPFYQHRGSPVLSLSGPSLSPDIKKEFLLKRINMKKEPPEPRKGAACMGSRVLQELHQSPGLTAWAATRWKLGQRKRKEKANFRVSPSGTARKLRVRGSKSNSTSQSSGISLYPAAPQRTFARGQYWSLDRAYLEPTL